VTPYRHVVIL